MSRPASIAPLEDSIASAAINLLVYGYPGEGKTPLWGTGGNTTLIMDSDGGVDSARALGSKAHSAPVTDYSSLEEMYEYLRNEDHPYRWVVWDSLTLFQDRTLIDEIMVNAHMENPDKIDEDVPAVRHYLKNMNRISRYVRSFAALPINFGITCHVMTDTDHNGEVVTMPLVQGKGMPSKISGYMNVIGFLGKAQVDGKPVQRLLTRKTGRFYARDRFNALGSHVDKPTIPKIEKLIDEKRAEISGSPSAARPAARRRRRTSTTK